MKFEFDLTYVTMDSVSEGVGSSQVLPLVERMAQNGLSVKLISFEKRKPSVELTDALRASKVSWTALDFGRNGAFPGLNRIQRLAREIPQSKVIHARSDLPVLAANLAGQSNVLWDIRSLWGDQRSFMANSTIKREMYRLYPFIEDRASRGSIAISTLTSAVVPILERRHATLPTIRTVNPTSVNLSKFSFVGELPTKLVALFSGTYNSYYDLDISRQFLESIRRMAKLEIYWARPIESTTKSLHCGEDQVFSLDQEQMPTILPRSSFGVSICKENAGPSLKAAMPTKIAEFLSTGRPVVVNEGLGDFDSLLLKSRAGVVIKRGDNLSLKAGELIELCRDPETPIRCRQLAERHFNFEDVAKRYLAVYGKISKS
jgi:glycosyltransferase involved in cell wall biosynthesis